MDVVAVVVMAFETVSSPSCLAELKVGMTAAAWDDKHFSTS